MPRLLIFLSVFTALSCSAQVVVLEGIYMEKNLYIQNPAADTGFCTQRLLVNGKEIPFADTGYFVIQLDSMKFRKGDKVKVEIFHKPGCKPSVLHTLEHYPKSTFEGVSVGIDTSEVLRWQTKESDNKLPFIIEQFRWNRWIKLAEISPKPGESYEQLVKPFVHSGLNQFRLKQVDNLGIPHYSKALNYTSAKKRVMIDSKRCSGTEYTFSEETMYQVYDQYGALMMEGTGKTIDISQLPKGHYFLNYDNMMGEFIKH
ncbi:MAG: hypothetical protein JWO09_243 [Bacteroidetes bacterium]|nr:hypothetical protein [Bacteroidota bacterium]